MASRTLGVHGKDRVALVPVTAGDAAINVAGMMFLSERGPETVEEKYNSKEFLKTYGDYVRGFYGKYSAEGFFGNLQGQEGVLLCRRFVAGDALAASVVVNNGDGASAFTLKSGTLNRLDKGIHGNKLLYEVLHKNKVEGSLVSPVLHDGVVIFVNSAIGFSEGDHIVISDGVDRESFKIIEKDENLNSLTLSSGIVKGGGFGVTPSSGKSNWGFSAAKTTGSTSGLNDAAVPLLIGTVDVSAGVDWSGTNDTFGISYKGGSIQVITLNANCADDDAIAAHIQARIDAAIVVNDLVVSASGGYIQITSTVEGTVEFFALSNGGGTVLATIGWLLGTYSGTNGSTITGSVSIDGDAYAISTSAINLDLISDVIAAVTSAVGAEGTVSWDTTGNGAIKVVAASSGLTSIVSLSGGIFSGMADANPSQVAVNGTDAPTVKTLNFNLIISKKNAVGVILGLETWENLSMSPDSPDYFGKVNDVRRGSENILGIDSLATIVSDYEGLLPAETVDYVPFTGGANGTSPTNADWKNICADFDTFKDLRYMGCPENTSKDLNDYGENYCKTRGDVIWFTNLISNQTYDELLATGNSYIVSSDAYRMNNAQWLTVNDPIGVGVEPVLNVPNIGFLMGHTIYWISKYGYQRVPAGTQESIKGVVGVYGDQIDDDKKRTKLADAGINVIQFVSGSGICLRNARMASTSKAYKWFNQIFMRIYYKITFVQTFGILENVESGEALLSQMYNAVRDYMLEDYKGNRRTGNKSAFLVIAGSTFENVVTIICDASNNNLSDVIDGEVTIDLYFTPPPPAESIEIGVGISLKILANVA